MIWSNLQPNLTCWDSCHTVLAHQARSTTGSLVRHYRTRCYDQYWVRLTEIKAILSQLARSAPLETRAWRQKPVDWSGGRRSVEHSGSSVNSFMWTVVDPITEVLEPRPTDFGQNWLILALNGTNKGLFQVRFQNILAWRVKTLFSNQISEHLTPRTKTNWNRFWKCRGFVPFDTNLPHIGPKSGQLGCSRAPG